MSQATETRSLNGRFVLFFGVGLQIFTVIFLARIVVDIGWRMLYPFIPQLSTGLGLTVVGFSWLIFVRSMAGLTGSLFGVLSDRYGRRMMMAAGLGILAIGLAALPFTRQWWAIGPILLYGLGCTALVPIQQAYISDLVAYEKRGRALASIDVSYSIAGIIGMPLVGWLIDAVGWQSPFFVLSLLALITAPIIWFSLPAASDRGHHDQTPVDFWAIARKPNVLAAVGAGGFLFWAVGCYSTIWGIWFSEDFGLDAIALGAIATVISLAELAGVTLSSLFIDRIGKRFGSQVGLLLLMLIFFVLPWTQGQLSWAITVLVVMGTAIEFTIVSMFPLYSVQAPEARATIFAVVGVGISIGLAVGSPVTAILWERLGLAAVCTVAILSLGLALYLVQRFLHEQPEEQAIMSK